MTSWVIFPFLLLSHLCLAVARATIWYVLVCWLGSCLEICLCRNCKWLLIALVERLPLHSVSTHWIMRWCTLITLTRKFFVFELPPWSLFHSRMMAPSSRTLAHQQLLLDGPYLLELCTFNLKKMACRNNYTVAGNYMVQSWKSYPKTRNTKCLNLQNVSKFINP